MGYLVEVVIDTIADRAPLRRMQFHSFVKGGWRRKQQQHFENLWLSGPGSGQHVLTTGSWATYSELPLL